jgi:hypothetical protein
VKLGAKHAINARQNFVKGAILRGSKMSQKDILEEISTEREKQDRIWGGPDHDDDHSVNDWVAFITEYAGRARKEGAGIKKFRVNMIRVAALAVAAVESADRAVKKAK